MLKSTEKHVGDFCLLLGFDNVIYMNTDLIPKCLKEVQ